MIGVWAKADVAILRHAIVGLRAIVAPPAPSGFTYLGASFWPLLIVLLLVGIPPDAFVRHLLVPREYEGWNVAIDVLAIVGTLWVCGVFGSMAAFPHDVAEDAVRFNLGLLGHASCRPCDVLAFEAIGRLKRRELRALKRDAGFLTMPGADVVRVDFAVPVPLRTYPYVRERPVSHLFVTSDRPRELLAALERARGAPSPRRPQNP
jgi:hypothetical protein